MASDPLERLLIARAKLEEAEDGYLRANGWTHSSSHPDCRWRWTKAIEGETYHLSTKEAMGMQVCLAIDDDSDERCPHGIHYNTPCDDCASKEEKA